MIKDIDKYSSDGIIELLATDDLKLVFANEDFYALIGYTHKEYEHIFHGSFLKIVQEEDRNNILENLLNQRKEHMDFDIKLLKRDDEICMVHFSAMQLEDALYRCIIVERTEYETRMEWDSFDYDYDLITNMTNEILFEYNLQTEYLMIPQKYKRNFEKVFHITFSKLEDNAWIQKKKLPEANLPQFMQDTFQIEQKGEFFEEELKVVGRDGSHNWILCQCVVVANHQTEGYKIIGKIDNINKYKAEIEILEELNSRDVLTNVYNKGAIEKLINITLQQNPNREYGLFIIDIDYFKSINDTFGHIFGDMVLKEATADITKAFYDKEYVGRIGGDEFIVFAEYAYLKLLDEKAQLINHVFRKTYENEGQQYGISASIGISKFPQDGKTYKELLEKADIALYHVKDRGRNGYEIYHDKLAKHSGMEQVGRGKKKVTLTNEETIEIISVLVEMEDLQLATQLVLDMVCRIFGLDRVCIYFKDEKQKFSLLYEYNGKNKIQDFKQIIKSNLAFHEEQEMMKKTILKFLELFGADKHYHTLDYFSIQNILQDVGFLENTEQHIQEFYVSYLGKKPDILGYVTFEKYNISERLTEEEVIILNTICRVLYTRIQSFETDKKLLKEIGIKNLAIENQNVHMYIVERETYQILYFNHLFEKLVPEVSVGSLCYELMGRDRPCKECYIHKNEEVKISNLFFDQSKNWIVEKTLISWETQSDAYMICAKDSEKYVLEIYNTDILTGIYVIDKFRTSVEMILKNQNKTAGIITFDIDKFKYINDTWGYTIGDEILKIVARVSTDFLRENEFVCRMNEDKFALYIQYDDDENGENLEERLKELSQVFYRMQRRYFKDIKITIIMGAYAIQEGDYHVSMMIDKANIARKSVKNSHENIYQIYTKNLEDFARHENFVEGKMLPAIEQDEFIVYLQPKFNLETNEVYGAEALVRWQTDNTLIYPDHFIPIFEKNGFITRLDFVVYEKVFQFMESCLKEGLKVVPISLNVSRGHIQNINFTETILELIEQYHIPIELIELEITESIFVGDKTLLKNFISKLRNHHIRVSIDDFGTAYSSLNLLKDVEVDVIKIDQEFLQNINSVKVTDMSEKDKIIIHSIVDMAKKLNFHVICEGVETKEQVDFLKEINCMYGQGYVLARPMTCLEFKNQFLIQSANISSFL